MIWKEAKKVLSKMKVAWKAPHVIVLLHPNMTTLLLVCSMEPTKDLLSLFIIFIHFPLNSCKHVLQQKIESLVNVN
jgi:hypothetical protein